MTKPVLLSTGAMMSPVTDVLDDAFDVHWMHKASDPAKLLAEIAPRVEAICTGAHAGVKTSDEMMAAMPRLKVIGNFGVGYDSIDVAAAAKRGIVITNTPDVLNEEVADTAIGLLLNTIREFPKAEAYVRAGNWAKNGDYRLTPASLRDRKVGFAGFGRIGKAIARRLEAFGVPIVYFGRTAQANVPYKFYDNIVEMARDVDTLMLILPGGPATQKLINAEVLKALGPRGIVINMARGSVVDEAALMSALHDGTIMAAGLDVFLNEPNIDPAWLEVPNLTVLPHVGSASQVTRNQMWKLVADNLLAYAEHKAPLTPVPETPFKSW